MNNKYLVSGALLLAFAAGRFLTPVKIETKTVEVEKKQTETDRDKHKDTTTVVTEKPDGTKVTETRTAEDTKTHRDSRTDATTTSDTTKIYGASRLSVAALGCISSEKLSYGLSLSKNILGPITAGVWGLTSGTFGVSLGVEF